MSAPMQQYHGGPMPHGPMPNGQHGPMPQQMRGPPNGQHGPPQQMRGPPPQQMKNKNNNHNVNNNHNHNVNTNNIHHATHNTMHIDLNPKKVFSDTTKWIMALFIIIIIIFVGSIIHGTVMSTGLSNSLTTNTVSIGTVQTVGNKTTSNGMLILNGSFQFNGQTYTRIPGGTNNDDDQSGTGETPAPAPTNTDEIFTSVSCESIINTGSIYSKSFVLLTSSSDTTSKAYINLGTSAGSSTLDLMMYTNTLGGGHMFTGKVLCDNPLTVNGSFTANSGATVTGGIVSTGHVYCNALVLLTPELTNTTSEANLYINYGTDVNSLTYLYYVNQLNGGYHKFNATIVIDGGLHVNDNIYFDSGSLIRLYGAGANSPYIGGGPNPYTNKVDAFYVVEDGGQHIFYGTLVAANNFSTNTTIYAAGVISTSSNIEAKSGTISSINMNATGEITADGEITANGNITSKNGALYAGGIGITSAEGGIYFNNSPNSYIIRQPTVRNEDNTPNWGGGHSMLYHNDNTDAPGGGGYHFFTGSPIWTEQPIILSGGANYSSDHYGTIMSWPNGGYMIVDQIVNILQVGNPNNSGRLTNYMIFRFSEGVEAYINGGGAWGTESDYRLKENIQPIPDTMTVDNLKPCVYNFKSDNDPSDIHIGFIAHELQEVFPQMVMGEKDGEEMQKVNTISLIPILVKEVQDLKKLTKQLIDNITQLMADNIELKSDNVELKSKVAELELTRCLCNRVEEL